jgi:hypothetical protein
MYGSPPFRKRKVQVAGWSAQMYTAFVGGVPRATVQMLSRVPKRADSTSWVRLLEGCSRVHHDGLSLNCSPHSNMRGDLSV